MDDYAAAGRAIIDANLYMVLGTAELPACPGCRPSTSPPTATGIPLALVAGRPPLQEHRGPGRGEIVVFDSSAPISQGQGVYMSAVAEELAGDEAERGSRCSPGARSPTAGSPGPSTTCTLGPPPPLPGEGDRDFVLDERDERVPVDLA